MPIGVSKGGSTDVMPSRADQLDGKKIPSIDQIKHCYYCRKDSVWDKEVKNVSWICPHCTKANYHGTIKREAAGHSIWNEALEQAKHSPNVLITQDEIVFVPSSQVITVAPSPVEPLKKTTKTIYLSGPMNGHLDSNLKSFRAYTEKYQKRGYEVISPAEIEENIGKGLGYLVYLRHALHAMLTPRVSAIYVLPGWETSWGANFEIITAKMLGIPIFEAETGLELNESILERAERTVMVSRKKDYGHPIVDFTRTAGMLTAAFKHKLKEGEKFDALDFPIFMMITKISRLVHTPGHEDSLMDIAGYVKTYELVEEERKKCQCAEAAPKKLKSDQSASIAGYSQKPEHSESANTSGF